MTLCYICIRLRQFNNILVSRCRCLISPLNTITLWYYFKLYYKCYNSRWAFIFFRDKIKSVFTDDFYRNKLLLDLFTLCNSPFKLLIFYYESQDIVGIIFKIHCARSYNQSSRIHLSLTNALYNTPPATRILRVVYLYARVCVCVVLT